MIDHVELTDDLCSLLDEYSRDESGICLMDLDCWPREALEKLFEIAEMALHAAMEQEDDD